MGIRPAAQYQESLQDGRSVYIRGENGEDITAHPILGLSAETVAQGFALSNSPDPDDPAAHRTHGRPPLAAQKMMIRVESPLKKYMAMAKAAAGIQ